MKYNERYLIDMVIIEIKPDGSYGNIYNNVDEFRTERPFEAFRYGYIVVDRKTGYIPENCNEWNDTIEEAIFDCENNCIANTYTKYITASSLSFKCTPFLDVIRKNGMKFHSNKVGSDPILINEADGVYYRFTDEFKAFDRPQYIYEFQRVDTGEETV